MTDAAIIFDCDGVLVDSERIAIAVERDHLARIGLVYESADYLSRFVGLTNQDFYLALENDHRAIHNRPLPTDFFEKLKTACWARYESELTSFEGLLPLLDTLRGPVAVASSSSKPLLHRKLEITELHGRFDPHIYSGDEVARGKPSPDLFLLAAERIERDPAQCLVIEDSINGVRAAVAAGMEVWGFTGGGHADAGLSGRLKEAGARKVFSNYPDMLPAAKAFAR
ncbi:HAD family phosphatase [Pelagibius sp. Alg239-R121]|uniref:HAD family hydrolase n=1 Tax=Pelagibius sp. Alg239-R121 TaxID=2993448 RepID=UPI0024A703BB|nr:HAD family hydrolase [Pelagibius sp. Alg239-R121]